jgi:uncharacterized protein (DUF2235 family)
MKRIIVCCDGNSLLVRQWLTIGTWEDSDKFKISPTNVTLLSRSILQNAEEGTDQLVLYQPGIGTELGWFDRVHGGAFGVGLMDNIREAYTFIAYNWHPGDSIYLFGFSRGSYTARSVAGLISLFGLLTKRGMDGIPEVLDAYSASKLSDPNVVAELAAKYERKAAVVPIKFVGVWDTVGSLGIPDLYILGIRASWFDNILAVINKQYQFSDTNLHPNIEFAFHAYLILRNSLILDCH